jgi:MHS family citrate/tricarballylate:H+ symporter-like MFS transporter
MTTPTPGAPVLLKRHILAAAMGNALEFYDFLTYAFVSVQIGHAFYPQAGGYGGLMLSLATFMAGFLTRPLGAYVLGNLSDRRGRRLAMTISYTLMGGSILIMALIPPYSMIGLAAPVLAVASRMLQGFSLGGEVGSNSAFLVEAAPPRDRGLVVSWQGASQYIAGTVGSLVGLFLTRLLPSDIFDAYGWRIAFLLGAVTLPFGIWLRRGVPETLHAPEPGSAGLEAAPPEARLGTALRNSRMLVLGLVYLATSSIGTYALIYFATYAQTTLHMRVASGLASEVGIDAVSVVVILLGGWLSDRIGRRPVMIWSNLAFLLLIWPAFAWIGATRSESVLILAPMALAMAANLGAGAFFALLAESLPKPIRGAGFALTYAIGVAIAGGSTQLILTWLIHLTGDSLAPAWYLIGATAIAQVALMLMKESAPARLDRLASLQAVAA